MMKDKIIIYGKNGQVGSAFAAILQEKAVVFSSADYDFSSLENIENALRDINCQAIINATAYTDVNKAESEEEIAFKANAIIPEKLALYCKGRDIPFIHYSTDYVFPGEGDSPQTENTKTAPLNAYGRSKLAGEEKVSAVGGKYLIFRTSWVYDHNHKNFFTTMLKLAAEKEVLSVVSDQYGAPTYAPHLAKATIDILDKVLDIPSPACGGGFPLRQEASRDAVGWGLATNPELASAPLPASPRKRQGEGYYGIYHLCNGGCTSWHGFARSIFEGARNLGNNLKVLEVKEISADQFPTPAQRPHNSRLNCSRAFDVFGVQMPDWKDGLRECLRCCLV